jgi:hypothetical protein
VLLEEEAVRCPLLLEAGMVGRWVADREARVDEMGAESFVREGGAAEVVSDRRCLSAPPRT